MARLILLNGPPGSGKSTLARRWAERRRHTTVLEIDQLRAAVDGWRERKDEAGLLARRQALAVARTQLSTGRDVVVPQLVARLEFVEQLAALAAACGAEFVELAIVDDPDVGWARLSARTAAGADPLHVDAGAEVPDRAAFDDWRRRLDTLIAQRPGTRTLTTGADVAAGYAALEAALRT